MRRHGTSIVCTAARILSLGYGILIALFLVGVAVMIFVQGVSDGKSIEAMGYLAGSPF